MISASHVYPQKSDENSYGELMNCLLKERERYATDAEFQAYTLAEVRRFITDLRTMNIELAVRTQTGKLEFASPKE